MIKKIITRIKQIKIFSANNIHYCSVLVLLFAVMSVLITYIRLYFSFDFTDEAFSTAVSYLFAQGGRPFADEMHYIQTSSLLASPLIRIYLFLTGSTEGVFLFMRQSYLFFSILTAYSIFLAFKNILKWQVALLISLASIVFIPFNIPNFTYNTLGGGFFTIGIFLVLGFIFEKKNFNFLFFSGIAHGLAIISYPPLLISVIIFNFLFLWQIKKSKYFLWYGLGSILTLIFFFLVLLNAGVDNLKTSLNYIISIGVQGGGLNKFKDIIIAVWNIFPNKVFSLFILAVSLLGTKAKFAYLKYVFLAIPISSINFIGLGKGCIDSMQFVIFYSLWAPYLFLFIKDNVYAKNIFWIVWLPSFFAGLVTAWTSSNGYMNAAIGLFPASIVTTVFLIILSKENINADEKKLRWQVLAPVTAIVIFLFFQYIGVYRDDKIINLDTRMDSGPFKGIYTTREKRDYVNEFSADIKRTIGPADKIFIYDYFPAGYLFFPNRPYTNTLWMLSLSQHPKADRQSTIDYFKKNNGEPNIVIKIKKLFFRKNETLELRYLDSDPVNNIIKNPEYKEAVAKENYSIYKK